MESQIIYCPVEKTQAEITTPPTKTVYFEKEKFDPTGMVVKGQDFLGNKYEITEFSEYISSAKPLKVSDTVQEFYILFDTIPVKLSQKITVNAIPTTYCTVQAEILSDSKNAISHTSGSSSYPKDQLVSIYAFVKDGYEFVGWYDGYDTLVSNQNPYAFNIITNITLYAKAKEHIIPIIYNAEALSYPGCNDMFDNITVTPNSGELGTEICFQAVCKDGYKFDGWYDSTDTMISAYSTYNTFLISNTTLYAKATQQ